MTVKRDLKALQRNFKALGSKVEKLTKAVENSTKQKLGYHLFFFDMAP